MKRILTTLAIITLVSCSERGEVREPASDFIIIHGKTYKLMRVVPSNGAYPKDSSDTMPTIINYQKSQGKSTINQAVIKVD